MPDKSIVVASFKYGLDQRRESLASLPGTLQTLQNAQINSGGEIEKRKAFVKLGSNLFADNTYGLQDTDSGLVTFGSDAAPNQALPTGVTYQRLLYPTTLASVTMTAVLFSCNFQGKAFVLAKFSYSDEIFAFYDGAFVGQINDGIVRYGAGSVVAQSVSELAQNLADIINRTADINDLGSAGWIADANVAYSPTVHVITPTSANYNGGGTNTATVVVGSLYRWIPGANDTKLVNDTTTLTAAGYFVATTTLVTLTGTAGAAYTGLLQTADTYDEVSLAGSTLVMSPPGVRLTPVVEHNNSVAGVLGVKLIDQDYPGVPAQSASVAFTLNVGTTGTVTVTAPATAAGTGTAALSGGAVNFNTSLNQTATDIAAAINNNTFITGYTARVQQATVTVYAPASFGAFQNAAGPPSPPVVTVVTTGDITTTSGSTFSQIQLSISIGKQNITTIQGTNIRTVSRKITPSVTSLTPGAAATFTWSQVTADNVDIAANPANFFALSAKTGASVTIVAGLNPGVTSITGRFRCTVTDSSNKTTATVFFTVTMTAPV